MPRYTKEQAAEAARSSLSYSETLRKLGMRPAGGNHEVLKTWLERWGIPTSHFDSDAVRRLPRREPKALSEVMVEGSTYSRSTLKRRLFDEGLKQRRCEQCGQDEDWRGGRMALILDHINGVPDDHRLENLRILCPNCAACLDTHCGRKNAQRPVPTPCERCGQTFVPRYRRQRFCSRYCGTRWDRSGRPLLGARRVQRPSRKVLLQELEATSYSAVGRKYGVSDNAIRKWVRAYERIAELGRERNREIRAAGFTITT